MKILEMNSSPKARFLVNPKHQLLILMAHGMSIGKDKLVISNLNFLHPSVHYLQQRIGVGQRKKGKQQDKKKGPKPGLFLGANRGPSRNLDAG